MTGWGHDNVIRNNIFAFSDTPIHRYRGTSEPFKNVFSFTHNIVYFEGGQVLGGFTPWEKANSTMKEQTFNSNIYWSKSWSKGIPVKFGALGLEEWRRLGQDVNSPITDPMFVDPEKGNFTLRPTSPASKIGFKPIDMSKVGPQ